MKNLYKLSKILLIISIIFFLNNNAFADNLLISSAAQQNSIYSTKSYYNNTKNFGIGDSIYIVLDEISAENIDPSQNFINNGEIVSAQVVQLLSNDKLLIQGKKTIQSDNQRMNFIITGIINPKSISNSRQVLSRNISDLKISFLDNKNRYYKESNIINKIIKHLL